MDYQFNLDLNWLQSCMDLQPEDLKQHEYSSTRPKTYTNFQAKDFYSHVLYYIDLKVVFFILCHLSPIGNRVNRRSRFASSNTRTFYQISLHKNNFTESSFIKRLWTVISHQKTSQQPCCSIKLFTLLSYFLRTSRCWDSALRKIKHSLLYSHLHQKPSFFKWCPTIAISCLIVFWRQPLLS